MKSNSHVARWALAACLTLSASSAALAGIYTTTSGGAVPDNTPAGVSSSIIVGDLGLVNSFDSITINGLNHTWIGDLVITLSHGTTTIDILDKVGSNTATAVGDSSDLRGNYRFILGGADFTAAAAVGTSAYLVPDNVSYAPVPNPLGASAANGLLSNFIGLAVAGTWTLNISDRADLDTGSFTGWSFSTTNSQGQVPVPGSFALLGLGLVGLLRKRSALSAR